MKYKGSELEALVEGSASSLFYAGTIGAAYSIPGTNGAQVTVSQAFRTKYNIGENKEVFYIVDKRMTPVGDSNVLYIYPSDYEGCYFVMGDFEGNDAIFGLGATAGDWLVVQGRDWVKIATQQREIAGISGNVTAEALATKLSTPTPTNTDPLVKQSSLEGFVRKDEGKGLSTNDYTDEDKEQVERVRNGSVVVDNTLSVLDETSNKPVSGGGINNAIGISSNNALAGFSGFQMINKDDFTIIGEYITKNGYISTNPNAMRTDFIPLNGRKIVCVDAYINPEAAVVIAFFDANKKYISGILPEGDDGKTYSGIAPDNACYVVFCNYSFQRRRMASIFASEESLSQRVNSTVYTYNAPLTAQSTSFINASNGWESSITATSASGKSTWYVDIKGYSTLRFNGEGGNASVASVAFYDENFTYLPDLTITAEDATAGIVDFNEEKYNGVRYVRVSHYRYPVSRVDYSKFVAEFRTDVNIVQRLNTLDGGQGLNVLVFGDSITDCANITVTDGVTTSYTLRTPSVVKDLASGKQQRWDRWPVILRNAMACKEVRNYALSGATYKDVDGATTRKSLSYQVNLALADVDNAGGAFNQEHFNPDIIVFALGTNDGIANDTADSAFAKIVYNDNTADVEATLNSLDRTKFCEAAMWAFLTIKNAFPYAQCFCYLPIQRNSNNNPIGNVHSELIKVANRFGVLVIDGGYGSGIVREISNFTLGDGLHPNWRGQNLMARQIISAIKCNYVPLDSSFMNKEQPTE